ncbi:MAG: hypothetical protein U5K54_01735 [Cytophagales bacterium]|nr:hypothetical protein [Cytophagales bacterium]
MSDLNGAMEMKKGGVLIEGVTLTGEKKPLEWSGEMKMTVDI